MMSNHPQLNQLRSSAGLAILGNTMVTLEFKAGKRPRYPFPVGRRIKKSPSGDTYQFCPVKIIKFLDKVDG